MTPRIIERLKGDEFAYEFSFISNPIAVHRALQQSKYVEDLRVALRSGEISEATLRGFSETLLKALEFGKRFHFELALAAVAVALETRSTPFAEEYILNLARLELAELATAIRVARKSCQERLKLPENKTRTVNLSEGRVGAIWQPVKCTRANVASQFVEFEVA